MSEIIRAQNSEHLDPHKYGNKAARLVQAQHLRICIPDFIVIPVDWLSEHNPQDDGSSILNACRELQCDTFVVRSSGLHEDLEEQSMAGQALSITNVHRDSLLEAAKNVHRSRKDTAVIIQQQIDADFAGVLFTLDPISGNEEFSINYNRGIAEDILSGFEDGMSLKWSRWNQPPDVEFEIEKLIQIAKKLHYHYGQGLDIEWASQGTKMYLIQVRPITSLQKVDEKIVFAEARKEIQLPRTRLLTSGPFSETSTALTPISAQLLADIYSPRGAMGNVYRRMGYAVDKTGQWFDIKGGYPYLAAKELEKSLFPEKQCVLTVDTITGSLVPQKSKKAHFFLRMKSMFRSFRLSWKDRSARDSYPESLEDLNKEIRGKHQQFASYFLKSEPETLIQLLDETWEYFTTQCMYVALIPGFLLNSVITELELLLGKENLLKALPTKVESPLTQSIRQWQQGTLSRDEFMAQVGNRAEAEYELANPRWNEQPSLFLKQHKSYPQRKTKTEKNPLEALGSLRAKQCEDLIDAHQRLQKGRELAKHHAAEWLALLRKILLRIGDSLGIGDHVMYLYKDELKHYKVSFNTLIHLRKKRRNFFKKCDMPLVLGSNPSQEPEDSSQLNGLPLSAGKVTAKILFLDKPNARDIPPDTIICAPNADPAWAVDMTSASGFICERGTLLCHCAVMAREIGIPAIAGIKRSQLENGSIVCIDAYRGTITKVDAPSTFEKEQ